MASRPGRTLGRSGLAVEDIAVDFFDLLNFVVGEGVEQAFEDEQIDRFVAKGKGQVAGDRVAWPVAFVV